MRKLFVIFCFTFILFGCKTEQKQFTQKSNNPLQSILTNTIWKISYNHKEWGSHTFEVVLIENGKVACFNPFDTTPNNDEWEEKDGHVYIYFNNRDAVYEAVMFDDEVLVGTAHSQIGGSWNWIAKRFE